MMVDKRLQQQLIAAMNGAEASAAELAQLLSLPVPEVEAGLDSLVQQRKVTRLDTAGGVRYRVGLGPKRVGDLLACIGFCPACRVPAGTERKGEEHDDCSNTCADRAMCPFLLHDMTFLGR